MDRKYLPTFSDLIDRLTILQLKEVHNESHKEVYKQEIKDIVDDLETILYEKALDGRLSGIDIRDIIILAQYNTHIWNMEDNARKGDRNGNDLMLTHSLNGIRNRAKNRIENRLGGRTDPKVDCIASEYSKWEPSW